MSDVDELWRYLATIDAGQITASEELKRLLASAWDAFEGGDHEGMAGYKLRTRELEDVEWEPPVLRFNIERHGAAAQGSSRAERQRWTLHLERRTALVGYGGQRQIRPLGPRFDKREAARVAEELVQAVLAGADHAALEWRGDRRVRILVASIIPPGRPKETLQKQRKRLREALKPRMADAGWQEERPHVYAKVENGSDA